MALPHIEEELVQIKELPKIEHEEVQFQKYEGKVYDDDTGTGYIRIEQKGHLNFEDFNVRNNS